MNDKPVAVVTGAARGIGRATALEFARRGHDVAIVDLLADALAETGAAIEAAGGRALVRAGDLTDLAFAEGTVDAVVDRWGRIDALINNAAWRERTTMRRIEVDSWERTLRICLTAPAFLARWSAKVMEERNRGVIINVSSINSTRASGIAPAYVAAKAGLDGLTYELAALYGRSGIRVLSVNPGAVDTEMSRDYASADGRSVTDDLRVWSEEGTPLGRWATPEESARAIVMLTGDDASYITGTTIRIDGGISVNFLPHGIKSRMHPQDFH